MFIWNPDDLWRSTKVIFRKCYIEINILTLQDFSRERLVSEEFGVIRYPSHYMLWHHLEARDLFQTILSYSKENAREWAWREIVPCHPRSGHMPVGENKSIFSNHKPRTCSRAANQLTLRSFVAGRNNEWFHSTITVHEICSSYHLRLLLRLLCILLFVIIIIEFVLLIFLKSSKVCTRLSTSSLIGLALLLLAICINRNK